MIAPTASSRRAFTLIELLVVIAIIGILMTLLFSAAQPAIDAANKAKAKNDATQIATAVNAYIAEYGKNPPGAENDNNANGDQLMDALCPPNPNQPDETANPRGIVFLEIPNAKNGKNGRVEGNGAYKDPWGEDYQIYVDSDYDSVVTGPEGDKIRKSVIVWSKGKDKTTDNASTQKKDDAKSWE